MRDDVRIEIGRKDAHVQLGRLGNDGEHGERHRIRFLSGRAGRRPKPDAISPARRIGKRLEDRSSQMLEVMRLSEKAGHVRRQRGDHAATLGRVVANRVAVIGERRNSERSQPLRKARIDESRLRLGQVNSRLRPSTRSAISRKFAAENANSPVTSISERLDAER